MSPNVLGLKNETWMPLFWLCNSQGQRDVYRTFSVIINMAGWRHVSYEVKRNKESKIFFLMLQHEVANKPEH